MFQYDMKVCYIYNKWIVIVHLSVNPWRINGEDTEQMYFKHLSV